MTPQARVMALTLLALAVPTFAFGGEEEAPGPAALSVSASLSGCGLANAAIVCQVDASWGGVEGAEHYTVSVTRADGSVMDLGETTGTSRSIFVPYVGPGTYSVQVAAWGTPPGEEEPTILARDTVASSDEAQRSPSRGAAPEPDASRPPGEGRTTETPVEGTSLGQDPVVDPPVEEPPVCEEPDPEPEPGTEGPAPVEEPDGEPEDAVGERPVAEDETDPLPDCE